MPVFVCTINNGDEEVIVGVFASEEAVYRQIEENRLEFHLSDMHGYRLHIVDEMELYKRKLIYLHEQDCDYLEFTEIYTITSMEIIG